MRRQITAVAMIAGLVAGIGPAAAQDEPVAPTTLRVSTDYPSVTTQAGETITFTIEVTAAEPVEVDLEVVESPADWTVTLRGGGFVINGITAAPESPPTAELEVTIPPEADPGSYPLGLQAGGGGQTDRLDLTVTVADAPVGGISLTTDFASLRGRPSDTFQYDLEITNQTPEETTFAFNGRGPEGWTVTAGPASEERASTVTVGPGETESVRVEAVPPSSAPAGTYPIEVFASGGGESGSFTLTAEVTGQPAIELSTPDGRLDVSGNAGEEIEAAAVVVNTGSAPLEDIQLSADPPAEWTVEFEPEQITSVGAGESATVTVRIQPAGNAVAGDYAVGITATAGGETSSLALRYTVETSRWWGAIGIGIIVIAFVVLFVVFRRFGRR